MVRLLGWITPVLVLVCGCDVFYDLTGLPRPDGPAVTGKVGLKQFESAAEFREYFTAQVSAEYSYNRGGGAVLGGGGDLAFDEGAIPQSDADAAPSAPSEGSGEDATPPEDFSTTTTQEVGVQEADVIKNDGQTIYVLSDSMLRIVQADPGEALEELAAVPLEGYGSDLYLLGDKVVALTRPNVSIGVPEPLIAQEWIAPPFHYESRVQVTVIDVTDRAAPTIESTSWFEGNLASSRMIGDVLHLVLASYPDFYAPVIGFRDGDVMVAEVSVDEILPDFMVDEGDGDPVGGNTVDWPDFYYPLDPDGYGTTTVVSMDVNDPASFRSVGVVAHPGNIYASTAALYLTDSDYDHFGDVRQMTDIYKFAFTDDGPVLAAVGAVPGRILNQYSMSEYDGYLRVATTVDRWGFSGWDESLSTNQVYVLAEEADSLSIVGRAENLAPGEQIYSARFSGPRGYLVTFEQIDPLFTIDLSNPTDPRVVGKLKVPGFSTFIIEMDENHLLTIGRDAPMDGGFVIPQGVQLSIFDISNFADPQLKFTELIGAPDAWSEALYNPKALTYFAAGEMLTLPVEIYNYGFWLPEDDIVIEPGREIDIGEEENQPVMDVLPPPDEFRGVYVYCVTPETGFDFLGRMSTAMGEDYRYSSFTRGVFMNDNVFAVTGCGIVGAPVAAVDTAPWQVSFPQSFPDTFLSDDEEGGEGTVINSGEASAEETASDGGS